jgi:hypothetical protein
LPWKELRRPMEKGGISGTKQPINALKKHIVELK